MCWRRLVWLTKWRRKAGTEIPVFRLLENFRLEGSPDKKPPNRSLHPLARSLLTSATERGYLGAVCNSLRVTSHR